jgi:hypothetical protein
LAGSYDQTLHGSGRSYFLQRFPASPAAVLTKRKRLRSPVALLVVDCDSPTTALKSPAMLATTLPDYRALGDRLAGQIEAFAKEHGVRIPGPQV